MDMVADAEIVGVTVMVMSAAALLVFLIAAWHMMKKMADIMAENTFRLELLELRQRNSEMDMKAIAEQQVKEYNKLLDLEDSMLPTMPHNCMWGEEEQDD